MKIFPMLTLLVLVLVFTCMVEDSKATIVENASSKNCYPGDKDNNFTRGHFCCKVNGEIHGCWTTMENCMKSCFYVNLGEEIYGNVGISSSSYASILNEKISTPKLGRPVMLDAYTSNMCVKSWGRNTYARALIEVSAENVLLDSLIVAIHDPNGTGHTMEKIDEEYKWQPPRCGSCKIFDHNDKCFPKAMRAVKSTKAYDDGFIEVTHKKLNTNKVTTDPLRDRIEQELNLFSLKNSFDVIFKEDNVFESNNDNGTVTNELASFILDSDNKEVEENSFDAISKEDNVFESNNDNGTVTDELASFILDSDNEEVEEVFFEKDPSIESLDGVFDDVRKKVEAPPNKSQENWSGRKANSPKRSVAFSPETKVHYFDREDIEEVKHENAYSKKS
uniref:Uncharacterized protein n=1 Tax=Tanacetum cinerariifolium TaxID=118510 RepID=A0A6L2JHQ3_TANCI|nr:hypothetical protein [Tanacetum cinerariifolium]